MYNDFGNYESSYERTKRLPIYKKGKEIADLVRTITDLLDEANEQQSWLKGELLMDSSMLCAKIAGAEGGDLYDIRMECATIIRKSAMSLYVSVHSLRDAGFEYLEYYSLVRQNIEEFRLLFIDWVANFDKSKYIADRWGLFNPEGVNPDDNQDDGGWKDRSFLDDLFEEDE